MGPQRQRRRRTRKRRYVSLRRKLSRITSLETPHIMVSDDHHRQLDLFPLQPEPIHDEEEGEEGKYAAKFFDQECDTLNSILGLAAGPDGEPASPPGRLDSHQTNPSGGGFLARRALKGRERWEFCNDDEEGEGSSGGGRDTWWDAPRGMLCLKLDYQEILNAWLDKGPLYVDAEEAQVVSSVSPNQHQLYEPTSVYVDVSGGGGGREGGNNSSSCSSNLWMVPESREARVMRYREKRQSRLFAKKIRYEVRKLNAEKRPRIKGRFVKRVEVK